MEKVLLITNIPNPYRVPLFNMLSKKMLIEKKNLKVVFASESYKRRYFKLSSNDFNFDYTILNGGAISSKSNSEKTYFLYKGLWKLLKKERPSTIIVSGFSAATVLVLCWKLVTRTKYIIWSGAIEKENRNTSFFRLTQRKLLCRFASSFVVYGTKAKDYLMNMGVNESKISISINTVDTNFFSSETEKIRQSLSSENKQITFTYLGYLVPRKNVQLLLKTIKIVSKTRNNFKLDIIGEGSSREDLEKYVIENELSSIVKFIGFKQKDELPSFFANSNGLLFQTDFDIWGLVLNEAMAAGLLCLSSINAGATSDLIEDGVNGFALDFNNTEQVAKKIEFIIDNPKKSFEMGQRAAEFIRTKANLEIAANGFIEALCKLK